MDALRPIPPTAVSGLQALQSSRDRLTAAASDVLSGNPDRLTEGMVELMSARREAEVGSLLVRAADETMESTLDILR